MTSISFSTRAVEVTIRSAEREALAGIVHGMTMLVAKGISAERILEIGASDHLLVEQAKRVVASREGGGDHAAQAELEQMLETYFRAGAALQRGTAFPGFDDATIVLNTALSLGAPPIRLATRIHAQCEFHLWMEEADAAAIAKVIAQALKTGVFRPGMGWGKAMDLLKTPGIGDVVLSYSGVRSFPNEDIADLERRPGGDGGPGHPVSGATSTLERQDVWHEMSSDERWTSAMAGLRARGNHLQLTAASIAARDFRFGDGRTAADLVRSAD